MKIKRILLTGDDGYNSIGTRLLIHFLKDKYELFIAGTKDQQSGVGGLIHAHSGGKWERVTVDGIKGFWVDGSPSDAMECAQGYYQKPFDLIISGINLGANVSGCIISSGTYAAAYRGMHLGLAPRALVMSWSLPAAYWFKDCQGNDKIQKEIKYPGEIAYQIFLEVLAHDYWSADVLNINFPTNPTNKAVFTQFHPDITSYYQYPMLMDSKTHRYSYTNKFSAHPNYDIQYDTGAILSGYISITPCQSDLLDNRIFQKVQKKIIKLE